MMIDLIHDESKLKKNNKHDNNKEFKRLKCHWSKGRFGFGNLLSGVTKCTIIRVFHLLGVTGNYLIIWSVYFGVRPNLRWCGGISRANPLPHNTHIAENGVNNVDF